MELEKPLLEKLRNAVEYLYFWRHWWPEGNDIVMLWRDGSGICRRYCEATGGSSLWGGDVPLPVRPQVIHDDIIDSSLFEGFMAFALEHGILEAKTGPAITSAHNVDFYLVRTSDGRTNEFNVGGGKMVNERHNRIREIFLSKDGLLPFYEERNRLREEIAEREIGRDER